MEHIYRDTEDEYTSNIKEDDVNLCARNRLVRINALNDKYFNDLSRYKLWTKVEKSLTDVEGKDVLCICGHIIKDVCIRGDIKCKIGSACIKKFENTELIENFKKLVNKRKLCIFCDKIKTTKTACATCSRILLERVKNTFTYSSISYNEIVANILETNKNSNNIDFTQIIEKLRLSKTITNSCLTCKKKIDCKFTKCSKCGIPEKYCLTCDKQIDSKFTKCLNCSLKENQKTCLTCDKQIDSKYTKCYKCNSKENQKTCLTCNTKIDSKYTKCYSCYSK